MNDPIIRIQGLSVAYGDHQAVRDASVDIPARQITAIIGPSGCGKTTLLRSICRLTELVEGVRVWGQVIFHGQNIYDPRVDVTDVRKRIGLLAQRPFPLPMSIYENVAYGPRLHGIRKREALDAVVEKQLRAAGLWDEVKGRLHAPASALSVGQQQRLCLARGLAVEPAVLLCDEVTSALDPISGQRIEGRLLELKADYTIVLVTHVLRQARRLADYVVFMYSCVARLPGAYCATWPSLCSSSRPTGRCCATSSCAAVTCGTRPRRSGWWVRWPRQPGPR